MITSTAGRSSHLLQFQKLLAVRQRRRRREIVLDIFDMGNSTTPTALFPGREREDGIVGQLGV
jgi:hypothetical protein